jgi:hypothetical protein
MWPLLNPNSYPRFHEQTRSSHAMGWSTFILLRLLHIIYALYLTLSSRWRHFTNTSSSSPSPSTLRQKIPRHLAIAFVVDSASENAYSLLLEAVENAIQWCRAAEISRLTVFDKSGRQLPTCPSHALSLSRNSAGT